MRISRYLTAAVPAAWLIPNHYLPWTAAWQDGTALMLLALAAVMTGASQRLPKAWAISLVVLAVSVIWQASSGMLLFTGDAIVVLLYLTAFIAAVILGASLAADIADAPVGRVDALAAGFVLASIASVGSALIQWTGVGLLGAYIPDLPPGGRPFGNVAQPNHLSTVCFFGLTGLVALHQQGRVRAAVFWAGAVFLLLGIVMSGSRTGWLQIALLVSSIVLLHKRWDLRLGIRSALALAAILALAVPAWAALNDAMLLAGSRTVDDQLSAGVRIPLWQLVIDAIAREPVRGYGWQQMNLAQQALGLEHAPLQRHFEHSHSLALDLMVWAGVPVAFTAIVLGVGSVAIQLGRCRDRGAQILMIGVAGLAIHAMLELPHTYAYFLIPAGLCIGAIYSSAAGRSVIPIGGPQFRGASVLFAVAVAWVGWEYLLAEENHRLLRFETARIGVDRIESSAPELILLTQLQAFLQFARTEARPGMTPDELQSMRRTSMRFSYPPAMLRYALASGLNGRPAEAGRTLALICSIHSPARCAEARQSWTAFQGRYPALKVIPLPAQP